jgi:hypothetical protein
MLSWDELIASVSNHVALLDGHGCPDPWFRGHADQDWRLLPTIAREQANPRFNASKERRLYWDFRMLGAHLLPTGASHWTTLCYMQHHGLPTRLLDWTTSFAAALFFALRGNPVSPTIWLLNPYDLAGTFTGKRSISNLSVSFKMDYDQVMEVGITPNAAFPVSGDSTIERIRSQGGMFTFHANLMEGIETLCPSAVTKLVLDPSDSQKARGFLALSSTNDFSVFSDLDGLAKYLCRKELGR